MIRFLQILINKQKRYQDYKNKILHQSTPENKFSENENLNTLKLDDKSSKLEEIKSYQRSHYSVDNQESASLNNFESPLNPQQKLKI